MSKSEDNDMMTIKEINRLIDWLQEHGMTDAEISDCIRYIGEHPKVQKTKKDPDTVESKPNP